MLRCLPKTQKLAYNPYAAFLFLVRALPNLVLFNLAFSSNLKLKQINIY